MAAHQYFTVTIDTEEDNWGEYQRSSYTTENITRIPRLQEMLMRRGIRPTYLISYPVATDSKAVQILGAYREQGLCEIGSHPHPWNTPPIEEERTPFNSFISNLPQRSQFEKIRVLTDAITRSFGVRPTSHRSGRWGFNDHVAEHLIRLGYKVDTSIYPVFDWSDDGGPNFSRRSHEPFEYRLDEPGAHRTLLEVPPSIDFLQSHRSIATAVFQRIRKLPAGDRINGALSKLGVLNHVSVSPELQLAPAMIRLIDVLLDRGTRVINMFFHSPTLVAGCSPFARTEADVESFMARIDSVLGIVSSAGLCSATMSELTAAAVGASGVTLLRSEDVSITARP